MLDLGRDGLAAELEAVDRRASAAAAAAICSRVPKNRAPLGQTVAHIGLRPTEVRS